jgi:hypothetical protein
MTSAYNIGVSSLLAARVSSPSLLLPKLQARHPPQEQEQQQQQHYKRRNRPGQQQRNRQNNFLVLVKILLQYLKMMDDFSINAPLLHPRAKVLVTTCILENRRGNPMFMPLQTVLERLLQELVGSNHWNQAQHYCHQYIEDQKQQRRWSSALLVQTHPHQKRQEQQEQQQLLLLQQKQKQAEIAKASIATMDFLTAALLLQQQQQLQREEQQQKQQSPFGLPWKLHESNIHHNGVLSAVNLTHDRNSRPALLQLL